ncbi:hypothetical protein CC1G_14656 [Coprinopsis cinerea okayama7|uniref:DUF952 domain-containing protein n=1 Tax=Coprinopsis cinerea (strain Okayama-7 / 130 / ATCC MYA-4618 / FGSC 9003) TaxID=240176 RepID=D6RMJ4_COPC7|nr:hypothetical protein CC1G_14656 [Coprinopsis cinerea okayama7\|eukprot:XP_002911227.1 hypothetical protein CC1G_14656 [Coprinopsis cinerea okayama7\
MATQPSSPKVPTYVYKIIPSSAAPPNPLPDALPVSQLDQSSGFIHLSTAKQVPGTLKLFFTQEIEVYIARIPYAKVQEQITWEDAKGDQGEIGMEGIFPHLYNDLKLGKDEIESVVLCKREGKDVHWEDVMAKLSWLQY